MIYSWCEGGHWLKGHTGFCVCVAVCSFVSVFKQLYTMNKCGGRHLFTASMLPKKCTAPVNKLAVL